MNMKKDYISDALMELAIPPSIKGFGCLHDAIEFVIEDNTLLERVTKELYPNVAKARGTTASRVERAMRHAVEVCFERSEPDVLEKYFRKTVSYNKGKLTNSEFISIMAMHLGGGQFGTFSKSTEG